MRLRLDAMAGIFVPNRLDSRRRVLATLLCLIGIVLLVGGIQLITLGGSAYYVLAGLALLISAYLTWRGDRRGVWVYAAMLAATFAWSLWEGGVDFWALQARLFAPIALGFWVFWPVIKRAPRIAVPSAVVLLILAGLSLFATLRTQYFDLPGRLMDDVTRAQAGSEATQPTEWLHYGNDLAGSRYSPAAQITPANVGELKPAWTYHTGVIGPGVGLGFQATPLMVNDTLYLCTPTNIIIALDPDTGKQRWRFDPHSKLPPPRACRGVAYYKVPDATGLCAERIIFATMDARLMAVDANEGKLCDSFGNNGATDLWTGLAPGPVKLGYYFVSSAPTIVNGNVVIGGWVADGQYVGEPSGVIRAYSAATGKFAWAWDMDKPHDHGMPAPGQYYSSGTANSWGIMSGDEKLGLVYVPTGNATPDYWGAHRSPGSEKYSVSVVALDSRTGEARWSFQTSHHDLWDYDVSGQPTLIDLPIGGKSVPALIQPTKRGEVFLLDRRNGNVLAKVEERPVPQGAAEGDFLSPTQPFSVGMPSFDDTILTEKLMWGATPLDQLWCRIKFREARYEGPMTPPGLRPSITYPSFSGGINWGGVSIDPERRLMVVNWLRVPNYTRLVPRKEADAMGLVPSKDGGQHIARSEAKGGIFSRLLSPFSLFEMPAVPQKGTPFAALTRPFLSPLQMPCTLPPFGKIAAVDLDSRRLIWSRPLGTMADSGPFGLASRLPIPVGVPNAGGSLQTRSGLIFIGATQQKAIRAFNSLTGEKLWEAPLPAGGHANPMTYVSPKTGRQYVVISAGGNATLLSGFGDAVAAFALPQRTEVAN